MDKWFLWLIWHMTVLSTLSGTHWIIYSKNANTEDTCFLWMQAHKYDRLLDLLFDVIDFFDFFFKYQSYFYLFVKHVHVSFRHFAKKHLWCFVTVINMSSPIYVQLIRPWTNETIFWFYADFFSDSSLIGKSRFQDDTPKFVKEPDDSYYIIRAKPAIVECQAINSVRINFRCAGEWMEPTHMENIVDQQTSTKILSAKVTVERADVEEYFGGVFWCECFAYNTHSGLDGVGGIQSKRGTIENACKCYLSWPFKQI